MTDRAKQPTARLVLEEAARQVANGIERAIPPGTGFCLLLFDFGEAGNLAWVTNADHDGVLNMLREFAVKIDLNQAGEHKG